MAANSAPSLFRIHNKEREHALATSANGLFCASHRSKHTYGITWCPRVMSHHELKRLQNQFQIVEHPTTLPRPLADHYASSLGVDSRS